MNPKTYLDSHFPKREEWNPYVIQKSIVDGNGDIHLQVDGTWTQIQLGDIEYANAFRDELIALMVGMGRGLALTKPKAKDAGLKARGY